MYNPTIFAKRPPKAPPYYLITFDTLADKTRWLLRHGFILDPSESIGARWTCTHNGSDFTRWLEIYPLAHEHYCNPMALCLKVYLHLYRTSPKPHSRPSAKPIRDSLPFYGASAK